MHDSMVESRCSQPSHRNRHGKNYSDSLHLITSHPRFHLHFTPTSASWLNLVERWFGLISQQAIRRGSFDSVAQLERVIARFVETWNQHAQPFVWTKTAQQIRRSIRNAKLISET